MRTMYISEPTFPAVRVLGLMVVPTFKNSPQLIARRRAARPGAGPGSRRRGRRTGSFRIAKPASLLRARVVAAGGTCRIDSERAGPARAGAAPTRPAAAA
jgi:hypothetical protein